MTKLFLKPEERSFTVSVARARFAWLLLASLLLPVAASLSSASTHSERFQAFSQGEDAN